MPHPTAAVKIDLAGADSLSMTDYYGSTPNQPPYGGGFPPPPPPSARPGGDFFAGPVQPSQPAQPSQPTQDAFSAGLPEQPPVGAPVGWRPPADVHQPAPGMPTSPTTATVDVFGAGIALAGAAAVVAVFLPWVKIVSVGIDGLDLGDLDLFPSGRVILALGLLLVSLGFREAKGQATTAERGTIVGVGLAIAALALWTKQQVDAKVSEAFTEIEGFIEGAGPPGVLETGFLDLIKPETGIGVWLAVAAGLLAAGLAGARIVRS